MLQRSAMGKKFRQYFITIEEAWNSPEHIMERAMQIAHQRSIAAQRHTLARYECPEGLSFLSKNT